MVKKSRTKFLTFEASRECSGEAVQMCLIHRDFKHFARAKAINFGSSRKVSSIMRAKVLSIMRPEERPLRRD
jgi:hypothetical protein